jgi:hypothetical protein
MGNRMREVPAHRLITIRQSRGIELCDALRSIRDRAGYPAANYVILS